MLELLMGIGNWWRYNGIYEYNKSRYLFAFVISQLIYSIIGAKAIDFNMPIYMYLYILMPVVALSLVFFLDKYTNPVLLHLGAYIVLGLCFVMFWTNGSLIKFIRFDLGLTIAISINLSLYIILVTPRLPLVIRSFFINMIFYIVLNAFIYLIFRPTTDFHVDWCSKSKTTEIEKKGIIFIEILFPYFIIPQFLFIFYVNSFFSDTFSKYVLSYALFLIPLITLGIYSLILHDAFDKAEEEEKERKELLDQIKREQGYR